MSAGYQVYAYILIIWMGLLSLPFFLIHLFVKGRKLPENPTVAFLPILWAGMFFWDKYMPMIPAALFTVTGFYGAYIIYGGKDDRRR